MKTILRDHQEGQHSGAARQAHRQPSPGDGTHTVPKKAENPRTVESTGGSTGMQKPLSQERISSQDKNSTATSDPQPVRAYKEAREFIRRLTGMKNPAVTFQTYPERSGADKGVAVTLHGTLKDHWKTLVDLSRRGAAVAICLNKTDLKGAAKANITRVRAVFGDLDGSPLYPVREWTLPPHIITETSPGRYQFFLLTGDVSPDEFPRLQHDLAKRFSGDISVKNINRCVRLPGFIHWKGKPFLTRVIENSPHGSYSREQLLEALGSCKGSASKQDRSELPHDRAKAYELAAKAAGECERNPTKGRHGAALCLGYDCVRAGLSRKQGILAAKVFHRLARASNSDGAAEPVDLEEIRDAVLNAYKPGAEVEGLREGPEIISARDFMERDLPPIRWIVTDLLPEGLTLFCGAPKKGKSFAMLHLATSVALGDSVFDHFPSERGGVLYLYLEDGDKVTQDRLKKLLGDCEVPENIDLASEWDRGEKGVAKLDDYLGRKGCTRLVIIDCLAEVMGEKKRDHSQYQYERRAVTELQKIAQKYGIAILVVHHTRKAPAFDPQDMILGTNGLASAADSTWIITSSREGIDILDVRGRNLESQRHGLRFDKDTLRWTWCDPNHLRRSVQRMKVIEYLDGIYPETASLSEITKELGRSKGTCKVLLARMVREREIERVERGAYKARTPQPRSDDPRSTRQEEPAAQ